MGKLDATPCLTQATYSCMRTDSQRSSHHVTTTLHRAAGGGQFSASVLCVHQRHNAPTCSQPIPTPTGCVRLGLVGEARRYTEHHGSCSEMTGATTTASVLCCESERASEDDRWQTISNDWQSKLETLSPCPFLLARSFVRWLPLSPLDSWLSV